MYHPSGECTSGWGRVYLGFRKLYQAFSRWFAAFRPVYLEKS
jgi:hypothetical protein